MRPPGQHRPAISFSEEIFDATASLSIKPQWSRRQSKMEPRESQMKSPAILASFHQLSIFGQRRLRHCPPIKNKCRMLRYHVSVLAITLPRVTSDSDCAQKYPPVRGRVLSQVFFSLVRLDPPSFEARI